MAFFFLQLPDLQKPGGVNINRNSHSIAMVLILTTDVKEEKGARGERFGVRGER